jgi:SAM-dependent methyltransferase
MIKEYFTEIYKNNIWENGSGWGSHIDYCDGYIDVLKQLIQKYNIKTVLDYGCGDWQFSKTINWNQLVEKYIGVDVVEYVVNENIKNYSNAKVSFDLISDNYILPKVDLIICKDVLQHLPNSICKELLENFKQSSKYILVTNDYKYCGESNQNEDCEIGRWRLIDLEKEPWNIKGDVVYDWTVKEHTKKVLLIKNE